MTVIIISGLPGAGSSTIAKCLAKELKLDHFSAGDYTKSLSSAKKETDKALDVWKNKAKKKEYHTSLDKVVKERAKKGNVVIEGKLAITMVPADLKIWLSATKEVRAERFGKRDDLLYDKALSLLEKKEELERKNWQRIYGFDYTEQGEKADIVVDTSDKTPDEILDIILDKLEEKEIKK